MESQYNQGLQEVARGSWAWLQPDGSWGWSNAGLITDGDHSLLVDTLYDLKLTANMLERMGDATPAARRIDVLVNSHADGDHTYGNELVGNARIIASAATAAEFFRVTPQFHEAVLRDADALGEGARYIAAFVRARGFDFSNITLTPPTETYDRELFLKVGDKDVRLFNVGPAHTAGDTLVHSVQDRTVFAADLMFLGVHPAIWEGSVDGWLSACDLISRLDVDVVVPGHGPLTDKAGVALFKTYLETVRREARLRFEAGMTVEQAAADIVFNPPFDAWLLPERVVGNVNFLYRQWGSPHAETEFMRIFDMMARYATGCHDCLTGRHVDGCGHS